MDEQGPSRAASVVRVSLEDGEKRTLTSPPLDSLGDGGLAISPGGEMLAFIRRVRSFEGDIYLLPVTTEMVPRGEARRVTFDKSTIGGLAWTADGHGLVFSSQRGGRRELWRMSIVPPSTPVRISAAGDDPSGVAVSREGHHLAYSHPMLDMNIWRILLDGKAGGQPQRLISSTRIDEQARYSPEGKRIAFFSNRSGSEAIWMSNADGSDPVQLTGFRNAWAGSPRWSPDGQKIAFDCNAAGNWDVYVISSQGGKPIRLTTSDGCDARPSWSRDGRWIYYCSTRTGRAQIWKTPASGGEHVQVTKNGGGCSQSADVALESPDGREVYYPKQEGGLWKVPVGGGRETKVLASIFPGNFAVTKKGIYFVDGAPASDSQAIKFLNPVRHELRTIMVLQGPIFRDLDVSPDEQSLLFTKTDRQVSEVMLIDNFR